MDIILAYKGLVRKTDGSYHSPNRMTTWVNGTLKAYCSGPNLRYDAMGMGIFHKDVPAESCSCGIYSGKEVRPTVGYGNVLVQIQLGGKIIPYTDGYKSEEAQIVAAIYPQVPEYPKISSAFLWYGDNVFDILGWFQLRTPSIIDALDGWMKRYDHKIYDRIHRDWAGNLIPMGVKAYYFLATYTHSARQNVIHDMSDFIRSTFPNPFA